MASVGILLIVKNEAGNIGKCLESVSGWADQIVVVDSGSDDGTIDIASRYTKDVYLHTDWEGFGVQRQRAQCYLQTDWVFAIDADEIVSAELSESVLKKVSENKPALYCINRLSSAFGKRIRHSGWSPDWIVRLYPREKAGYNNALVHEKVENPNKLNVKKLKGFLYHDTYQSLDHYTQKTTGYLKAWADEREGKKSSSIFKALLHAWACFIKMYIIKRGFMDGRHGFILAWLGMHSTFYKYADLWLRGYKRK